MPSNPGDGGGSNGRGGSQKKNAGLHEAEGAPNQTVSDNKQWCPAAYHVEVWDALRRPYAGSEETSMAD